MSFTWDGLPVAQDSPTAVAIVVWRQGGQGREFLLLHRMAPGGPEYEGDWAWTPPAGARQPGEPPDEAASRELQEETTLSLQITAIPEAAPSNTVALYLAHASREAVVTLDDEHDRFEWLPLEDALTRCLPAVVADGLANAAALIVERSPTDREGRSS